ncbi:phage antirepressor KilAC domain-containing protein [Clostridioides difficile]|nr:phage antirepressor KilAC domain-containing protein [Clostridioides difficile]MDB9655808.1 BRO family protein [Clostridioides difficile]MDE3402374.1 BRO family protein [Clostridioides difficile]MDN9067462.1 phage antirepressor KilAC domain-containing protein [Clostridioides difficile]MDV9365883.1 BRO family protein [Clostridioides difficile]
MNNLQIFKNNTFGEIRVIEIKEEPWFVGKDIAEKLGYKDTSDALKRHVDDEDKGVGEIPTPGGNQNMRLINESGLYSLILSSKLSSAKTFKRWVTNEILPSIRKTGGYIHTTEDMTDDEIMARALQVAQRKIESKNRELEEKNRFINQIASSKNSLLVREVAKVISKSNGIIIGEKRLYEKLRLWGLVFKNSTEPKQFAVEKGYLETVEGTRETSTGVFTYRTTRVTGKGQEYILKRLLKEEEQQLSMLS